MNIRPATPADLEAIEEIDCVVESTDYLHIDRVGDGLSLQFKTERRPLREKLISPNAMEDETAFTLKQIVTGADEGTAIVADHDQRVLAMLLAQERPAFGTIEVLDLRVDYDFRRQGLATVLLYRLIELAREQEHRAVFIATLSSNAPAAALLEKLGFVLSGLDLRRRSNHDLVKESATLLWYYETK